MFQETTSSQAPGKAAASSSPGLGANNATTAFESACGPAYVLPPLYIDTSPISIQLPLSYCPIRHKLYEAKAPAPLGLPPSLSFALINGDGEENQIQEQGEDDTSASISAGPSSAVSLVALLPSRGDSASPLSVRDSSSLPSPPSLVRAPSPRSPPSPTPLKPTVPRCSPPRAYVHHAFPSPPPTPPLEGERSPFCDMLPPALTPTSEATKSRASDAPVPRHSHLLTRRYLAPAFVRGEMLPFAIAEELDEEDEKGAGTKPKLNTKAEDRKQACAEPETSESEYSMDSAAVIDNGDRAASEGSKSASSISRKSGSVEHVKSGKGNKPQPRAGVKAIETRAKKTVGEVSRLRKRIQEFMVVDRGVTLRKQLRL